jgi:hypothetical protein
MQDSIPVTARIPSRLDELGEDALAVLGYTVIELPQGAEVLPRILEVIDEVEVGLASLLVQRFAIMHDSGLL